MGLFDALRAGVIELLAHKMRSFLTMLGIIFGVAAVIAMVSISEGARYEFLEQIRLMGVDVIHIQRRSLSGDALMLARKNSPQGLSYSDAEAIREVCSFAQRVVPVCRVFGGVEPGYQEVNRFRVGMGRFIDDVDVERRARVCVLGAELKRRLFPFKDPIGQYAK